MRVVAHNGARILGGAERATILLVGGLQARGHDVLLLCNSDIVAEYAREASVPAKICVLGGDVSLLSSRRFSRVLLDEKPDALIVGTWKKLFLASWAAKRAGVNRVVARVGLETDTPRSAKYRIALRRWTDTVVVNSGRMIEPFASLSGFGPDRVRLIHNGVIRPRQKSLPGEVRRTLGIAPQARVIGAVARLASQKRIDRLLRSFALLPGDVHCIVAGSGPEQAVLLALAKTLGLADRVHFLGHREDRGDVLDALDLFVITSDTEGLSNAMLEAMSFGLPIVSTPVSGASEALKADGSETPAGIVAGFDETGIANTIRGLLDDPQRLRAMGSAASKRATREFSLESMLDKWEAVLTHKRAS